jgi:integrase
MNPGGPRTATEETGAGTAKKRRRARGKGSLFKRGHVWWIAVSFRGQPIRESTGHADRRKAQDYLDFKLAQLGVARVTGAGVITSELRQVTVRQRLEALVLDYQLRGVRSLAQVRAHLGFPPEGTPDQAPSKILKAFGPWRVVDLSEDAIDRYIRGRLKDGAAPATCNREVQLLGQAVRPFFVKLGLPAPAIRHQSEAGNVRQGFFERGDFEKLVAALPEDLRDLARFGYLAGWRRGEIATLRWADVDREGGVIRLRPEESKNGRGRTLVLAGELVALIQRRWQARQVAGPGGMTRVVELVFHRDGDPIVDFRKAWATACTAAGAGGRLFHDLRRTAVRNMVRAGVPERVAMEVSGHRTRSVFDRYNIVSEADLKAAMERTTAYVGRLPVEPTVVPLAAARAAEGGR